MQAQDAVPVIIVGGGPVGLSLSILLSLRKIPHLLFERHPDTAIHPKACGINQRTTEIFRVMGVEEEVYRHAAPMPIGGRTGWYTSLGEEGREIISRDAWGGGKYEEEYLTFSPSKYATLPQIRLEPILKRRAVQLNQEGIFFNAEVLDAENNNDYGRVKVNFRDKVADTREYKARYILIADGGRKFTDKLGIKWLGEADLFNMVSAHIRSPIRSYHPDPRNFITWFINPDLGGSTRTGYLYQIGPWDGRDPKDDEWVFACGVIESDPRQFDEVTMLDRMRRVIGIPDLPAELISLSHWNVNSIYAERWRQRRILLVGDSAHKIPPWGALGMNSGIQDAQNLVWKLQYALDDEKNDKLLDTYETERLDIGRRVGETSLHNMRGHANIMDAALGIAAGQSPEGNRKALAPYFDPSHPEHSAKREAVKHAQEILDIEFKAPGYEVGWFYPSADINNEGGATLHDGQQNADGSLHSQHYFPSTIPGHHLPHLVLQKGGRSLPIRDLISLSQLVLFVGQAAPDQLHDQRVCVELIGPQGWQDVSGDWQKLTRGAAVLVRPDGIIAWRGHLESQTAESWTELVDRILCSST